MKAMLGMQKIDLAALPRRGGCRLTNGRKLELVRADAPLGPYWDKRDFDKTPEPAGALASSPTACPASWSNATAPARLHYDFRLEIDGVLVSWAVPKGVTLDPKARHLAVHVEDHPLDYVDFEGVIPAGEYGGGDVIVWDRGTWELHGARRRARGGRRRRDPRRAARREAARPRRARAHRRCELGQGALARAAQARRVRGRAAGIPRTTPQSVISGLTNDEIAAHPRAHVDTRDGEARAPGAASHAPTRRRARRARRAGREGNLDVPGTRARAHEPRQGAVPGPRRRRSGHQARPHPLLRVDRRRRCSPTSSSGPSTCTAFPTASITRASGRSRRPKYAPDWIPRWRNEDADTGESELYLVADSPPALAWLANHAAVELHPWTSRIPDVERPDVRADRPRSGRLDDHWDELITLARLHRTALEHLGVRGYPKTSGRRGLQVWVPIEPGPTFDETRAWVERLSRSIAARGRRSRERRVGEAQPRRPRPPRLHPERDQQDAGRAVQRARRARARRCRCRSAGTSSTTPSSAPIAGRSAAPPNGSPPSATSRRPCSATISTSPTSYDHAMTRGLGRRTWTDATVTLSRFPSFTTRVPARRRRRRRRTGLWTGPRTPRARARVRGVSGASHQRDRPSAARRRHVVVPRALPVCRCWIHAPVRPRGRPATPPSRRHRSKRGAFRRVHVKAVTATWLGPPISSNSAPTSIESTSSTPSRRTRHCRTLIVRTLSAPSLGS